MNDKNRVYVESSEPGKGAKATILTRNDTQLMVEFATGFQMLLSKKKSGHYQCQLGFLEFVSDGKPVK